jgi:hypothetical protein
MKSYHTIPNSPSKDSEDLFIHIPLSSRLVVFAKITSSMAPPNWHRWLEPLSLLEEFPFWFQLVFSTSCCLTNLYLWQNDTASVRVIRRSSYPRLKLAYRLHGGHCRWSRNCLSSAFPHSLFFLGTYLIIQPFPHRVSLYPARTGSCSY